MKPENEFYPGDINFTFKMCNFRLEMGREERSQQQIHPRCEREHAQKHNQMVRGQSVPSQPFFPPQTSSSRNSNWQEDWRLVWTCFCRLPSQVKSQNIAVDGNL